MQQELPLSVIFYHHWESRYSLTQFLESACTSLRIVSSSMNISVMLDENNFCSTKLLWKRQELYENNQLIKNHCHIRDDGEASIKSNHLPRTNLLIHVYSVIILYRLKGFSTTRAKCVQERKVPVTFYFWILCILSSQLSLMTVKYVIASD